MYLKPNTDIPMHVVTSFKYISIRECIEAYAISAWS